MGKEKAIEFVLKNLEISSFNNLSISYDCGGIPEEEWKIIENEFGEYLKI